MSEELLASLRIAIVGFGIGGASAALGFERAGFKNIHVYESVRKLGEVGAGINVGPNLYRVLRAYGVADRLHEIGAVAIEGTSIRKGDTDKELAFTAYKGAVERYQAPIWVCHRAELHRCMVESCQSSSSIKILTGHQVTSVDFENTRLKYVDRNAEGKTESEWQEYDVIIAADGVKSNVRRQMLALEGEEDHVQDTGQAAYRLLIPRELMEYDPELKPLIEEQIVTRWIAHKRHIIAYPINNKTIYNMSTAHSDEHLGVEESWTSKGSKSAMLKTWHDYCPRIQKLLQLVPDGEVMEWKLRVHLPLKTWVSGNVVLMGDASHPTLPHLAQGAAQAVEDGAVLGVLFKKIQSKSDVHKLLKLFEKARKERVEWIVDQAYLNGKKMQAADADSEERDRQFAAVKDGGENPDSTASTKMQDYLFGWDCMKEAEKLYEQEWGKL